MGSFLLSDYDVVGLDFDHTLVQYNLTNLFQLQFEFLTKYLLEKNIHYQGMSTVMNKSGIDFIRKGLFVDIKRGNILKISANGTIIQASHGTQKLDINDIIEIYGPEKRWLPTDSFIKNKLYTNLLENPVNDEMHTFLDFTNCVATTVFAEAVNLFDKNICSSDYKCILKDILEAMARIYQPGSNFVKTISTNKVKYVYKCEDQVIEWLKELKRNCKLLLISAAPFASVTFLAKYCLCSDWEKLFHTVICEARKPYFFSDNDPFMDLYERQVELSTAKGQYIRGNWKDLHRCFSKELGRSAKCIYIGDNLIQDIYAPSLFAGPVLHTVSISEEAVAEGIFPGVHPHGEYIKSNFWGSYFEQNGVPTLMGDIITKHSKLCVPLIKYLSDKPLDYQHVPFWLASTSNRFKS